MHDHPPGDGLDLLAGLAPIVAVPLGVLAAGAYLAAVAFDRRPWPVQRSVCWILGLLTAVVAVAGPWAPGGSFEGHVVGHLLLGMVTPLLVVLAAPVTVLLRALPVPAARALSGVLGSRPVRILTEPLVAAALTVGGLWLLYTTSLYAWMHTSAALSVLVHGHMFLAGYLFTAAIVGVDPMPHRRSYPHRAAVLILALAAHDVLAKYLYAHPPVGVTVEAAERGAMTMYYGGDAVDLVIIVLLCAGWYRARSQARSPHRSLRLTQTRPR